MGKDFMDNMARSFRTMFGTVEVDEDGHPYFKKCSVDDFWKSDEPEEQPEPKSAKEKLEQAEFVECEVVDDRPLEIGFAQ